MQKVHDALSGSSSDSFSFKIAHVDGNLAVTCSWANPNAPGNLRATISLDRSPEAQQICLQFLRPLTLNHSILLENLRLAERICQGFRREAETAQQQVADFVLKKEQLEDELYVKFAALLNEKKGKLKEWRQKAEDWERRALAAERRLELVEGGETERDDSAATQMSEEEDGASDTALPQGEGPDKSGRPALDSGGSMPSNTRSLPIAGGASMLRDSLPADLATADTLPFGHGP
eukprot:jgi/Botrbrau1/18445/Bobra.0072s0031.2